MVDAYGRAYQRLLPQIRALEESISLDIFLSRENALRLASMQNLRRAIVEEVGRYAIVADQEIVNLTDDALRAGLNHSRLIVNSYFDEAFLAERNLQRLGGMRQTLSASWNQLVPEQVETMIGFLSEDSPLHSNLVNRLGTAVAERFADKLSEAIALGINPREVARTARNELGIGLQWSLTTARTAQMWTYREATRANYMANSDVVSGWTWLSSLDERTCMSCISKHGERFSVDVVLADHYQGRCVAIPDLRFADRFGIEVDEIQPGEQWFNAQPEAKQRAMMGPGMFDAWKAGEFAFSDLSQRVTDKTYGEMFREATLIGLIGKKAQRYYAR